MKYQLNMDIPSNATPEKIASMLEQSASQVREMSSANAAHGMKISPEDAHVAEATVNHGTRHENPVDHLMKLTSAIDDDGILQQVADIMLDREEISVDRLAAYFSEFGTDNLYNIIASAIDTCEELIAEAE